MTVRHEECQAISSLSIGTLLKNESRLAGKKGEYNAANFAPNSDWLRSRAFACFKMGNLREGEAPAEPQVRERFP